MRRAKLEAARNYLSEVHSINLPDVALTYLIDQIDRAPMIAYEDNDFVCYRQGGDEIGYGTIERVGATMAQLVSYRDTRKVNVRIADIISIATPDKAATYYASRSGK